MDLYRRKLNDRGRLETSLSPCLNNSFDSEAIWKKLNWTATASTVLETIKKINDDLCKFVASKRNSARDFGKYLCPRELQRKRNEFLRNWINLKDRTATWNSPLRFSSPFHRAHYELSDFTKFITRYERQTRFLDLFIALRVRKRQSLSSRILRLLRQQRFANSGSTLSTYIEVRTFRVKRSSHLQYTVIDRIVGNSARPIKHRRPFLIKLPVRNKLGFPLFIGWAPAETFAEIKSGRGTRELKDSRGHPFIRLYETRGWKVNEREREREREGIKRHGAARRPRKLPPA